VAFCFAAEFYTVPLMSPPNFTGDKMFELCSHLQPHLITFAIKLPLLQKKKHMGTKVFWSSDNCPMFSLHGEWM